MLRIEGNISHQSQNSHPIINLVGKSAIESSLQEQTKISHTVFGVVQSSTRIEKFEAIS